MKAIRTEKKIHKDCPFTREQILEMKSMLYNVNTGNKCCNPAPVSWAVGSQEYEQYKAYKEHKKRYKEWLEEEIKKLENSVDSGTCRT
jgi:hypothetical protein